MVQPPRQAKRIGDELERVAERAVIKIALDIHANLVAAPGEGGTPIDTAWASANWIPSVGSPHSDTVGSRDQVSTSVQQQGINQLLAYRLSKGKAYNTNNVGYIELLNLGSSPQAEAGFVQRAIAKAVKQDIRSLAS